MNLLSDSCDYFSRKTLKNQEDIHFYNLIENFFNLRIYSQSVVIKKLKIKILENHTIKITRKLVIKSKKKYLSNNRTKTNSFEIAINTKSMSKFQMLEIPRKLITSS